MGILKRVLGPHGETKTKETPSPIQNRESRVQVLPLHKIRFVEQDGGELVIVNLSRSGIGLLATAKDSWPSKGQTIQGVLWVGDQKFPAQLKIAHVTGLIVGCAFTERPAGLDAKIGKYFDVELPALKMTECNPKVLKQEDEGTPRWFRGTDNSELYFVENDGKLVYFYLSFLGNYLECRPGKSLKLGQVVAEHDPHGIKHKQAELIHFYREIPNETIQLAVRFIQNISPLDSAHRNAFCQLLQTEARASDKTGSQ